jgi:UDPglucose--hexose-1-phosphate uridylyltransferase
MASEIRQDLISGDWEIIAPDRAAQPHFFNNKKTSREVSPISTCPFENLEKSGNGPILARYPDGKNWRVIVVPNKYPALTHGEGRCAVPLHHAIYEFTEGIGEHILIITRDHKKNFAELDLNSAVMLFTIFAERYHMAAKDKCLKYVVPYFNWGPAAGASVGHPHYQMLSLPTIPSHTDNSLRGSEMYFKKKHRCARCDVIAFERKEKKRIIAENADMIAFAPYASKIRFEVTITPKKHFSAFEKTPTSVIRDSAALVQAVMKKMKKNLNDPDLNFFIHSAPIDGKAYPHHHWHIEMFPRISIPAGFEFSTGMYINTIAPENAAMILRGDGAGGRAKK